jgi:GxxExxY protein
MNANKTTIIHKELSYRVVGLAMEVYNELGYGFLEKVYENALMYLLQKAGMHAEQQKAIPVLFRGETVGDYCADIIVEDKILLELKSAEAIVNGHRSQILNYLKATRMELGILLNFGKKGLEYERFVSSQSLP